MKNKRELSEEIRSDFNMRLMIMAIASGMTGLVLGYMFGYLKCLVECV